MQQRLMEDMQEHIQEQDIIRQVLEGRQQSFAVLVDRYQHYVFTLALRYTSSREEAEELAQDVFVKAYRSLADFRGQSKFSPWLYMIVHRTCISFLRKKKDPTVPAAGEQILFLAERTGYSALPADQLEKRSEQKIINDAIGQLPGTDAQIISLFYQHGQNLEEIGTVLGITSNHVKVRLFRARQKLKEILLQHNPAELPYF